MISDMVRQQVAGYLAFVYAGALSGVAGALVNMFVKAMKKHKVAVWICDLAFWLALSAIIIGVNYVYCNGILRLYIFLGFFSGFLLFFCTINWVLSKIVNYILYLKKKGLEKV